MQKHSFDHDWLFDLGHWGEPGKAYNDSAWRKLDLPHDWSIELPRNKDNPCGFAGAFVTEGVGWYRKHFHAPREWSDQRVLIEFEGVYRDAEVWLNGHALGMHPYGYTTFAMDLTPYLELDADNVLTVRCAHNPPAPAFLDACDRLGMLVMDEAFDGWRMQKGKNHHDYHRYFDKWWRDDLDSMLLCDRNGRPVPDAADSVRFAVEGPAEIVAVANADPKTTAPYCGWEHRLWRGRALVVLRPKGPVGEMVLHAIADGAKPGKVAVSVC